MTDLYATCARGVEPVLAGELEQLGFDEVRPGRGGVHFRTDGLGCWRANLWLRSATRVLVPLAEFAASDAAVLYAGARDIPWHRHLSERMTLAVDCTIARPPPGSALSHSHFAALRVKDAVVDQIRDQRGARPSVDPRDPDVRIRLHLEGGRATLYLDSSGESLHRRGYRPSGAPAPLKETLAAAVLLHTGWRGLTPLCDPLCGSGTLLIEAALLARRRAPGLERRFGFERWREHDARAFARLREEARDRIRPAPAPLAGGDRDPRALGLARRAARAAGVGGCIGLRRSDLGEAVPPAPPPGLLITNPPYGERLGEEEALVPLYRALGDLLKRRFSGYTAWVLTGNLRLAKRIGLATSKRVILYNGPLECRLLRFELYEGSRRRR